MGSQECYLPPDTSERAPPNPSQKGWYSTYPRGMEGWVDVGGWLHTEMVYLPTVTHPSINRARCRVTCVLPLSQTANHVASYVASLACLRWKEPVSVIFRISVLSLHQLTLTWSFLSLFTFATSVVWPVCDRFFCDLPMNIIWENWAVRHFCQLPRNPVWASSLPVLCCSNSVYVTSVTPLLSVLCQNG